MKLRVVFFEKINIMTNLQPDLQEKQRTQINKIKNERGEIITNTTEIKRIIKEYHEKIPQKKEFPGSPVVRTRHFHCWGPGSRPVQGTKILQAMWHSQQKKRHHREKGNYSPITISNIQLILTTSIRHHQIATCFSSESFLHFHCLYHLICENNVG